MICGKCKKEAPEGAAYCPWCGRLLSAVPKKKTKRGNGMGYAFLRGDTYTIRVTAGYRVDDKGKKVQVFRTKGGFKTKKEALAYAETLKAGMMVDEKSSMEEVYAMWAETHEKRVNASTMKGYRYAMKHYAKISFLPMADLRPDHLQKCIDNCPSGKRTKQMMKIIANLLFKYAVDNDICTKNYSHNLFTGNDETTTREPLTELELQKVKAAMPDEPYAAYVVALCYLGFRPGELLKLKKSSVHLDEGYIIGGGKTKAGTNRPVTIPPVILPIIKERMAAKGDWLFPRLDNGNPFNADLFRKEAFQPLMDRLGIVGKVPYSCRHTYSDKLKNVEGDSGDKARLMGHTDYTFTQSRYQSTIIEDLKKITDNLT